MLDGGRGCPPQCKAFLKFRLEKDDAKKKNVERSGPVAQDGERTTLAPTANGSPSCKHLYSWIMELAKTKISICQIKLIWSDSWSFSSLTYFLVWTVSLSLRVGTKHQTKKHDVITGFMCTANYRGSVIYGCAQEKKND